MKPTPDGDLARRFARIKLFLCDVDGVLTNGAVWIGEGPELKSFHIQDGLGLRVLQGAGIRVGWVSSRPSSATAKRAAELKIDFLHQQSGDKVAAVETIRQQAGVDWEDICFVGDDIVDLGVMRRAGLAVAVANAVPEVMDAAHYCSTRPGGEGAVREVVEMILKAQDRWAGIVQRYAQGP